MNNCSPFKSAYLGFLQLTFSAVTVPGLQTMDANEKALFDALSLRWSQGQPWTVREAIQQSHLGSPATLHKRLKRLIAKNLVEAHHEDADRRSKYLQPSDQGMAYIEWLSTQILAVQAH